MGYVESNLIANEQIVFQTKLSWWAKLNVWIVLLAIPTLGIVLLVPWLTRKFSEFAVTNKRVIVKLGMINRRTVELNLGKVESIVVNQGVFGRMLDYGDIIVVGTGGTKEFFQGIDAPIAFRKAVQEALDQFRPAARI